MKTACRWAIGLSWLIAAGCEPEARVSEEYTGPISARTRGGALVLSRDERIAVMTARSAGVVTVFELDRDAPLEDMVTGRTELDLGADSEPWAAVIGADGNTAFVILRRDQSVLRIEDLRGRPHVGAEVRVGSEPTSIVIAPSGNRVFVANWGEGTVSVVTTPEEDFEEKGRIDLNAALVRTQVLGDVEPRPALAHPRALAITDDGDEEDGDETLYATEFFSMPLLDAGDGSAPGYFDRNRQGFVYPIPLGENGRVDDPISIAPVADTGLVDQKGAVTGCFPNQLYAAAIDGQRLFVTSVCASPVGPLGPAPATEMPNPANFKTVMHSALFVIDTKAGVELPELRQVLSSELEQRYAADMASEARMPLVPNDLAFTAPSGADSVPHVGCLTSLGSNAVFCSRHDQAGRLLDIGERDRRHIPLDAPGSGPRPARLPIGIAVSQLRSFALVASDHTHALSTVDLEAGEVRARTEAIELERVVELRNSDAHAGRRFFATGLDVWSYRGEARVSCEGCHPDGLSDGVTWFFSRGPRRTLSTASTFFGQGEQRVLLWTANVDEIHDVEGIVRSVAGGVGAVLWKYPGATPTNDFRIVYDGNPAATKHTSLLRQNLNASVKELLHAEDEVPSCNAESALCDRSPVHEWDQIEAYVRTVRSPRRPGPAVLESAAVERGAEVFRAARCNACHAGPGWTLSRMFDPPGTTRTGSLPYARPTEVLDEDFGRLRRLTYQVPEELRWLNPPGRGGSAPFRTWNPQDLDAITYLYGTEAVDAYNSAKTHGDDQINCVLRDVGTFPLAADGSSLAPAGAPPVAREVRQDMTAAALGATGFNTPSLLGLAVGAPYFHAGNARTLEELFEPAFIVHHAGLDAELTGPSGNWRDDRLRDLVAFLLAIDDDLVAEEPEAGADLCVLPDE